MASVNEKEVKTIGKDYTLLELLRFALPAILNEFIFNLLYTVDDGLFITRYVGTTAESAFSILTPMFMMHGALSSLFAGVAVLAARKMGEKKDEESCSDFTAVLLATLAFGLLLSLTEYLFKDQILLMLGATETIMPYAKSFFNINCLYAAFTLTGNIFGRFYVPAGSPKMELTATILNVGSNLLFDWFFVVYKGVGMAGAAYANLIAVAIQNIIGLLFYSSRKAEVHFAKPSRNIFPLLKESFRYGLSTFFSNMSVGIGYIVCNYAILCFGDESYLAAYTIANNIAFTFMSAYFGLFAATGPLLSYALGERNVEKLKKLFKQIIASTAILIIATILMFIFFSGPIAKLFVGEAAADIKDLIIFGLSICPYGFPFFGYNVGARMSFSALGNYRSSLILTILQEIVFSNLTIIALPLIFGIQGVWYSFLATNILTFFATLLIVYINRDNYGYGQSGLAQLVDR